MLYFSASVSKIPFSYRRSSRRITLSWVVVFPLNTIRLTKYCLPSWICSLTSTVGNPPLGGNEDGGGAASAAGSDPVPPASGGGVSSLNL